MTAGQHSGELKSRRYVTQGAHNVFHRIFLYGLGLTQTDMARPFAGLAIAHSQAVAGHGMVRGLADATKLALSTSGVVGREFVVPDTECVGTSAITARELVADSVELVVRGHWHDILVGVATTVHAAAGLAESICRLRIPGLVLMPQERFGQDPALAAYAGFLESIGLGASVSLDDAQRLTDLLSHTRDELATQPAVATVREKLLAGGSLGAGFDRLGLIPHVAAIAHEVGITSVLNLLGDDARGEVRRVQLVTGSARLDAIMEYDGGISSVAISSAGAGNLSLVRDSAVHALVGVEEVPASVSQRLVILGHGLQPDLLAHAEARLELAEGSPSPSQYEAFPISVVAGVTHPGFINSSLNYDDL